MRNLVIIQIVGTFQNCILGIKPGSCPVFCALVTVLSETFVWPAFKVVVAPVVAVICVLSRLCRKVGRHNSLIWISTAAMQSETLFNARHSLVNLFHSQITSFAVHRIYLCSQCSLLIHISRENIRAHVHLPLWSIRHTLRIEWENRTSLTKKGWWQHFWSHEQT